MFRKLITNLPFNPSLLGQVAYYTKRMHQEESIRRMGFGFMALAMLIQVYAVAAPPQKSLASTSSDYIINNLRTKTDLLNAWDGKTADADVAQIFGRFGLTRKDIESLPQLPNATIRSTSADYWTIGRTSLSAVGKSGQIKQEYKDSEVPVKYGNGTVYLRNLKAWDIANPYNDYNAFEGVKNGQKYWILVDCGNFTRVGKPPLNNPAVDIRKTIDGGPRELKPGDEYTFRFEYRNNVEDSQPAKDVVITDKLDLENFSIVSPKNLNIKNGVLTYPIGSVSYSDAWRTALTLTVKLKKEIPNGKKVCNAATITSSNAGEDTSGGPNLCIKVLNPCPLDNGIPSATDIRCTKPTLVCTQTVSDFNRSTKEATLKTRVRSSNKLLTHIKSYEYDFGDGSTKKVNSKEFDDTIKHTYKDGTYTASVVVKYYIGDLDKETKGEPCETEVETIPDQPLNRSKLAQNITQNLSTDQTLITKANGGDVIEYSVKVRNSYSYDRLNYTISDYIGDILDYATLDSAFLKAQGGTYRESTKTVRWEGQTVKANSEMTKKFRVTIKNPVPSTNQPSAITTAYDCVISNKYGNELSIPINCPIVKNIVEPTATTLPQTGPGTSLLIGFAITSIVAYFFARSRLLGKELELIRSEYSSGGGF